MNMVFGANHRVRDFAQMDEGTRQLVLATLGKAPPETDTHIVLLAENLRQCDLFEGLAKKIANNEALVLDWVSILNLLFIERMRDFHPESYDHMLRVRQIIREIKGMLQKTDIRGLPDYGVKLFNKVKKIFNLTENEWMLLEYAACFHDLGKMAFLKEFWNTPGKFTSAQRKALEAHVRVVFYLFEFFDVDQLVACLSVKHHYPNLGYPTNGIIKKIDQIMVAIGIDPDKLQQMLELLITVDLYEAMSGRRGYQRNRRLMHMEVASQMSGELGKIGQKYLPLLHALWESQSQPRLLCLAS